METQNILNEFENNINRTVNKKYLEVVNELNNGFNKILQTALSNADVFENLIRDAVAELRLQFPGSSTNTMPSDRDEEDEDTGFTPWNGKKEEDEMKTECTDENTNNGFGFKPLASNPWSYKKDVNEQRVVNLDEQVSRAVNSSYPTYPQNNNDLNNTNNGMYYNPTTKGTDSPPLENLMNSSARGEFDHLDTTNLTPIKSNKGASSKPQLPPYHETKIDYEGNADLIIEDKKVLDNGLIVRSFTCKQCGHKVSYKRNLVVHIERQHKMKGR